MNFEIESAIAGIEWLAIPNARASQLLAMQFQLQQSQWLSQDEILDRQLKQLRLLCRHAHDTVPYYRRRFNEVGWQPDQLRELSDWLALPLLTRRDIQQAGTDLHCVRGPVEHGQIVSNVTSGSTGQPVTTLSTTVTRLFYNALLLRQHLWHRRDLSLKLAAIRSMSEIKRPSREVTFDNWGPGTVDVVRTGPAVALDVHASIEEQADFLLRHDPDYLHTYPSVAVELAAYFSSIGQKLPRLREVRTFGEVLEPRVRTACREAWGVPVVDAYSSQELGHIALQCPEHEHYHAHSESVLVEVLDPSGRACPPGEVGRVVITCLNNFAMPLLRYDIGDFAEVGARCPCGRGLPVLKRIVGRQRNMFILPNGRKVWPALEITHAEQGSLPPVQQFQVVQRAIAKVELLVVAPRLFTRLEEETLRSWVARAVGHPMQVQITHVAEISRGPTGKFEDFRCAIEENG